MAVTVCGAHEGARRLRAGSPFVHVREEQADILVRLVGLFARELNRGEPREVEGEMAVLFVHPERNRRVVEGLDSLPLRPGDELE